MERLCGGRITVVVVTEWWWCRQSDHGSGASHGHESHESDVVGDSCVSRTVVRLVIGLQQNYTR